jgi:energy-coupling factor transport system permease protein
MLSDITLGQYFPAKSPMHRADPRLKLCLTVFVIVLIFSAANFLSLALGVGYIFLGVALSRTPFKLYLKSLKPILFIVVFTAVLNVFYGAGEPLWQWGFLKITKAGLLNSAFVSIRIVTLILASSVLTFTTSPTQLTDAIERLLKPLAKLRVPVHEFAMMMTIALRFVPLLLEETDKIMSAQKARGADMESGGLVQRIKALVPVLIPLFISAFRRAFDLATAMESRCYHGGEGRTKMKVLRFGHEDWLILASAALALGAFIALNLALPGAKLR